MQNYRRFTVWHKAYAMVLEFYHVTRAFPADERFGMTAQMRRAAVSIQCNFAEGMSRRSDRDKARFLYMAVGSANELEVHLELSRDLNYVDGEKFGSLWGQLREVRKMLVGFIKALGVAAR